MTLVDSNILIDIWTQDANITVEQDGKKYTEEFNVNGYTLSGIIGFRFD